MESLAMDGIHIGVLSKQRGEIPIIPATIPAATQFSERVFKCVLLFVCTLFNCVTILIFSRVSVWALECYASATETEGSKVAAAGANVVDGRRR